MEKPDWLPDMVSVNGEWDKIMARLYAIFEADFKKCQPFLYKMPVWWALIHRQKNIKPR